MKTYDDGLEDAARAIESLPWENAKDCASVIRELKGKGPRCAVAKCGKSIHLSENAYCEGHMYPFMPPQSAPPVEVIDGCVVADCEREAVAGEALCSECATPVPEKGDPVCECGHPASLHVPYGGNLPCNADVEVDCWCMDYAPKVAP